MSKIAICCFIALLALHQTPCPAAEGEDFSRILASYREYLGKVKNFQISYTAYIGRFPHSPKYKTKKHPPEISHEGRVFRLGYRGNYTFDSGGKRERLDYEILSPPLNPDDEYFWRKQALAHNREHVYTYDIAGDAGLKYLNTDQEYNHLYSVGNLGNYLGKRIVFPPPQDLSDLLIDATNVSVKRTSDGDVIINCSAECFVGTANVNADIELVLHPKYGYAPGSWRIGYPGFGTRRAVRNDSFKEISPDFWIPTKCLVDNYQFTNSAGVMQGELNTSLLTLIDFTTAKVNLELGDDYFSKLAPDPGLTYDIDADLMTGEDKNKSNREAPSRTTFILLSTLFVLLAFVIATKIWSKKR